MHELTLQRCYAGDPEFRLVCNDYAAAIDALEHFKDHESRTEEYRQIIKELEDEVLNYLEMQPLVRGQSTGK